MAKTIHNKGLYLALVSQLDKLARHNRQGSFRTKERYYEAVKRFEVGEHQRQTPDTLCPISAGERKIGLHHQDGPGGHPVLPRQDEPAQVSVAHQ